MNENSFEFTSRYNHARPIMEKFKRNDRWAHLDLPEKNRFNAMLKYYKYRNGKNQVTTDGDSVKPVIYKLMKELYGGKK